MWGDNYRKWFDLFAGIVVYRATEDAPGNDEGWVNVNEYEKMFSSDRLTFNGRPYTPSDTKQRNKLLEAILNNAGALCAVKLLERRRRIAPPSLDYRVTKFGRRVDAWGYGDKPGIRKRLFFFGVEAFFRLKKHWRLVTIGAVLGRNKCNSVLWCGPRMDKRRRFCRYHRFGSGSINLVGRSTWQRKLALIMCGKMGTAPIKVKRN